MDRGALENHFNFVGKSIQGDMGDIGSLLPVIIGAEFTDENTGFTFKVTDTYTVAIIGFGDNLTEITIPADITIGTGDFSVTSVGPVAGPKIAIITSITLPSSVTTIAANAFKGFRALVECYIGDAEIGEGAFDDCPNVVPLPPRIKAQSAAEVGPDASIFVTMFGNVSAYTYEWRIVGDDAIIADGASYSRDEISPGSQYQATVKYVSQFDTLYSVTSAAIRIKTETPILSIQANNITIMQDELLTLEAIVTNVAKIGSGPVTYSWTLKNIVIPGAESAIYSVSNLPLGVNIFTVSAVDSVGATSNSVTVIVNVVNIIFTSNLTDMSQAIRIKEKTIDLTVNTRAISNNPVTYQWFANNVDIEGDSNVAIDGATSTTYTVRVTSDVLRSSGKPVTYTCVASQTIDNITTSISTYAVIEFYPLPVIDTQPTAVTTPANLTASLSIVVRSASYGLNDGLISYQWQKANGAGGFNDITGAKTSTLEITSAGATLDVATKYRVKVTNPMGDLFSDAVDVIFLSLVPTNVSMDGVENGNITFSWSPVASATGYRVEVSPGSYGVNLDSPTVTIDAADLLNASEVKIYSLINDTLSVFASVKPSAVSYQIAPVFIPGIKAIYWKHPIGSLVSGATYTPTYFVYVNDIYFDSTAGTKLAIPDIKNSDVIKVKTFGIGSVYSGSITYMADVPITTTMISELQNVSNDDIKTLLITPSEAVKKYIKDTKLTAAEIAQFAVAANRATGSNSIKIDGVRHVFPELMNGKLTALISAGSNKIRIPDNVTESDEIVINNEGNTVQYKGLRGTPSVHYFAVKIGGVTTLLDDGDSVTLPDKNIVTVTWGSINLDVRNGDINSFPARVNPYLALNTVLIYTKATVDALVAGDMVPAEPRVPWALIGVTAGSLMRALERVVVVSDAAGRHLQRWVRIQYINGPASEGVNDTLADYGCGWICIWDASGAAPVY